MEGPEICSVNGPPGNQRLDLMYVKSVAGNVDFRFVNRRDCQRMEALIDGRAVVPSGKGKRGQFTVAKGFDWSPSAYLTRLA